MLTTLPTTLTRQEPGVWFFPAIDPPIGGERSVVHTCRLRETNAVVLLLNGSSREPLTWHEPATWRWLPTQVRWTSAVVEPDPGPQYIALKHRASGSPTVYWGPFTSLESLQLWATTHGLQVSVLELTDPTSDPRAWWG